MSMQNEDQNQSGWVYKPGSQESAPLNSSAANLDLRAESQATFEAGPHVEWTASEYVANPKSAGWFALLALCSILITVVVFLVTEDKISTAVVAVLGILVGVFAARQPKVLNYAIDNVGIHVGERMYSYESFKYFSVVNDQGIGYIYLMPLKRFMPPLTIHYDPSDEEKIANTLLEYLPYEDYRPDIIDNIAKRFRF